MSLPWHSNEKRNFICMRTIVSDIVTDGLRTIFKQEWGHRYQATLGPWDNTARIGHELHNMEQGRRGVKRENLLKFLNGNIQQWDCTVLFDAILYSKSIGRAGLSSTTANEVDNLRKMRNTISHPSQGELSESQFENDSQAVRNSFVALGLSTKKIDAIKMDRKLIASFQVLPAQPTHEVIHRTTTVSAITDYLNNLYKANNGKLSYFYISGNPGSGKSQLASEVGEINFKEEMKKQNGLTFVMTLNAENLDTLLESYVDFARRTNCQEDRVESILNSNQTTEVKIRNLRTQIPSRIEIYNNWLVIVDNVEHVKLVFPLLPERINDEWKDGQILITTQESSHIPASNSFTGHLAVSRGLDENESCELLTVLSGNARDSSDTLKKVAKELDYQPLALAAAAVYLQQVRETKVSPTEFSWDDYLRKLDEGKRRLTEEPLRNTNTAYSLTMTTAVLLAVEKAAKSDEVLKYTFHFLSIVSHESLPLGIAVNYVLSIDDEQDKEQVGQKIRKCSLILPEVNEVVSVRLHRVVHDTIKVYARKNKMEELEIVNSIEVAARSFYQFEDDNSERTMVPHVKALHGAMTILLPNSQTLYENNSSSEIWVMFSFFGLILWKYGEFFPAKYFQTIALDISRKRLGSENIHVATIYNNLGTVHQDLGDLREAKRYYEKTLLIYVEQLGSDHVDVAKCYNNLGNVHEELGDLNQAKQHHEKALRIRTEQLGSIHVDVAMSCNNLGSVHQALGDLQQAKRYHEKALHIRTEQLESKQRNVDVAMSYNNLGTVYRAFGDLQLAKQYHEKSLQIRAEQLGFNHVDVEMSYTNLGNVHRAFGDLQQAKQYHEKALRINREQLGSNHVRVATSDNNLGNVHHALGDLQLAKQYHEKALHIHIQQLESNHVNVATSYNNLGTVYQDLGDLQQAKQYYQKALHIRREQLGSNNIDVATSFTNLGSVLKDLGNLQQSKYYHEKALYIRIEQLGSNHVDVAMSCNHLVSVYQALGDCQQAKYYYEMVQNIRTNNNRI